MMFTFAQRMCVFAMAALGLFAQSTPGVPAQEARTSGMIGVTEGQIARLNVLNPGVAAPAAGVVCAAALHFWDGQGTLLKSATVSVLPGKSAYLDLFGDRDLALIGDDRREIRATITIPSVAPPPTSAISQPALCKLIGTLEVIDASSGKTQEVLGVGHLVPGPAVAAGNP
jgi:hypothetical protein